MSVALVPNKTLPSTYIVIMYCIFHSKYSSIFSPCLIIIILHNHYCSSALWVMQSLRKWQRICMLCQEENNSLTSALEHSKNTKINYYHFTDDNCFLKNTCICQINITLCPEEIAKKQANVLWSSGACFHIGNIVIMDSKKAFVW